MKLSVKTVQEVVRLAEQYHPVHNQKPSYFIIDDEQEINNLLKEAAQAAPERKVLYDYIENLPDDERCELIALAWLGRGDVGETPRDRERLPCKRGKQLQSRGCGKLLGREISSCEIS